MCYDVLRYVPIFLISRFVPFPAVSERSFSSQQRAGTQVEGEALEVRQFISCLLPLVFFKKQVHSMLCFICLFVFGVCFLSQPTHGGPRRVLFRPQPDVLFLTLQEDMAAATPSPPDTEEEEHDEEKLSYTQRKAGRRTGRVDRTGFR